RLVLTGAGTGQQALQEASARWAELRIPRREVFQALLGITGWLVVRAVTPLADDAPGEESMACRGAERGVVDGQLVLGHPHRHGLAQQPPGRRVEVLPVDHEPLGIDGPVDDL